MVGLEVEYCFVCVERRVWTEKSLMSPHESDFRNCIKFSITVTQLSLVFQLGLRISQFFDNTITS